MPAQEQTRLGVPQHLLLSALGHIPTMISSKVTQTSIAASRAVPSLDAEAAGSVSQPGKGQSAERADRPAGLFTGNQKGGLYIYDDISIASEESHLSGGSSQKEGQGSGNVVPFPEEDSTSFIGMVKKMMSSFSAMKN